MLVHMLLISILFILFAIFDAYLHRNQNCISRELANAYTEPADVQLIVIMHFQEVRTFILIDMMCEIIALVHMFSI
jgi:hypothetical protein